MAASSGSPSAALPETKLRGPFGRTAACEPPRTPGREGETVQLTSPGVPALVPAAATASSATRAPATGSLPSTSVTAGRLSRRKRASISPARAEAARVSAVAALRRMSWSSELPADSNARAKLSNARRTCAPGLFVASTEPFGSAGSDWPVWTNAAPSMRIACAPPSGPWPTP